MFLIKMAEAPCTSLYDKGLEDLGEEITCPICQEYFQEPKILPCLHYYCKECIRNLARRHHPFPCPECRRNTTLPQNDPDQLPTAFFVNRMKEVHTKMEKADGKVKAMCELCSGEEAEAFCRQCTSFICANCMRSHKKMKKTFAGHQVVTLVELKQGGARQIPINEAPPTLCKEHDDPMKIFCFDCNRLICRDCVIDGHTDHKREFIKKYAVQCRSMVTESLTPLKRIQADMKQCTKTIESTETDVSTQHAIVSETIRQSFAKIARVLKQREKQLLDKASEMRDQKLDALGAQKKNLQIVQAESQSLIEFVEHSLEGATDEEVISIYQQILPRVEEESKRHKQISLLPTTGGNIAVEISYNSDRFLNIDRVYNTRTETCTGGHHGKPLNHDPGANAKAANCSICLEPFKNPTKTKCGHKFCTQCLQIALHHSPYCPTCRKLLRKIIGNQPPWRHHDTQGIVSRESA